MALHDTRLQYSINPIVCEKCVLSSRVNCDLAVDLRLHLYELGVQALCKHTVSGVAGEI